MKHLPDTEKSVKTSAGRQPAAASIINSNFSGKSLSPPVQKKPNETGLPDQLKDGAESLSGYSLDDVNVHYNSSKPAQLNARAYAQGTDIHLGPGQEKHLPHEAWHVVQQKQGRVKPIRQMKGKLVLNDDAGLEREADLMGAKVLRLVGIQQAYDLTNRNGPKAHSIKSESIQLIKCKDCGKNIKSCKCELSNSEEELPSAEDWWKNLTGDDRETILRAMGTHEHSGGVNQKDKTTGGSKKGDSHGNSAGEAKSTIFRVYNSNPEFFINPNNWHDKNRVKVAKK